MRQLGVCFGVQFLEAADDPVKSMAALDAVRQWEFARTILDGVPVPVILTTTVNFRLE